MPFSAAISTLADTPQAVTDACDRALAGLAGNVPELAIVFFSPHHLGEDHDLATLLSQKLGAACLIGCMGESIVGTGREIENAPAISVWLGDWGGKLRIDGFHLQLMRTPDGPSFLGWPDALFEVEPDAAALLVLGDPFTFPVGDEFLPRVNADYPGMPLLGGMASGTTGPGEKALIFNDTSPGEGAVGVLLRGPKCWRQVVSQGCRPIGSPMIVTRAEDNIVHEINGTPPLVLLRTLYQTLPEGDQELVERGLHIGLSIGEMADDDDQPATNYVIRNLYGFDRDSGAMVVTDRVETGQVVQFHLRDRASASADLQALLAADHAAHPGQTGAALLFTCNGRGQRMFETPHHDAGQIAAIHGLIPVAGLFAAGELGPVAGTNFIHGFTASVLLFDA